METPAPEIIEAGRGMALIVMLVGVLQLIGVSVLALISAGLAVTALVLWSGALVFGALVVIYKLPAQKKAVP